MVTDSIQFYVIANLDMTSLRDFGGAGLIENQQAFFFSMAH